MRRETERYGRRGCCLSSRARSRRRVTRHEASPGLGYQLRLAPGLRRSAPGRSGEWPRQIPFCSSCARSPANPRRQFDIAKWGKPGQVNVSRTSGELKADRAEVLTGKAEESIRPDQHLIVHRPREVNPQERVPGVRHRVDESSHQVLRGWSQPVVRAPERNYSRPRRQLLNALPTCPTGDPRRRWRNRSRSVRRGAPARSSRTRPSGRGSTDVTSVSSQKLSRGGDLFRKGAGDGTEIDYTLEGECMGEDLRRAAPVRARRALPRGAGRARRFAPRVRTGSRASPAPSRRQRRRPCRSCEPGMEFPSE